MVTNNNNLQHHSRHQHDHSKDPEMVLQKTRQTISFPHFVKPAGSDFIYIADGAFDIVWKNVVVYILACSLHFYSFWLVFHPGNWSMTNAYSFITCKFFIPCSRFHVFVIS